MRDSEKEKERDNERLAVDETRETRFWSRTPKRQRQILLGDRVGLES